MMTPSKEDEEYTKVVATERSLRSLLPTYSPSLVFSHGKKYCEQTFCTLSDGCHHVRSIPEMRQMACIASCYGWLIMLNNTRSYLFNPTLSATILLPPLKHRTFYVGVLTSPPTDVDCVVVFVSLKRKSFIYCRIGDNKWAEKYLGPKKENFELGYTLLVSCRGKIYVFYRQGMVVIDVHDGTFATNVHEKRWLDYTSYPDCQYLRFFAVESCGELFHVIVSYLGYSNRIVQTLDVFKLDVCTMTWVRVGSLGDRIFLLGTPSSTSFSSTDLGLKGNCLYFCSEVYTTLNRFDMEDGTITTTLPCPKQFKYWNTPFWVVPNCTHQVKKKVAKVDGAKDDINEEKGNWNEEKGNWKELPKELLELILSLLILNDYKHFQLTCKAWINITPPIQPSLIQSKFISQPLPWLLAFPKDQSSSNIYHPIYSDAYVINFPHKIVGAIVRCAKYGWLLMSRGKYSHFFFNPSTMETIKLPDHHVFPYYFYPFVNISFSSPPTSSDCVVLGHCLADIVVYRKSDDTWYEHSCFGKLLPSYCNQVFCDGLFYSLSIDGKLGVFNPNETNEENMWRDFPNTIVEEFRSKSYNLLMREYVRSYIVEYDSEIFSIFVGHWGKPVWVYKLDRSKMTWVRLESLGDKVIFLCQTASIIMPAPLKGIENRIYFPRFQGRDSVFYSLSTGKYHSFGGKESREDWMNTREYRNCTWVMFQN